MEGDSPVLALRSAGLPMCLLAVETARGPNTGSGQNSGDVAKSNTTSGHVLHATQGLPFNRVDPMEGTCSRTLSFLGLPFVIGLDFSLCPSIVLSRPQLRGALIGCSTLPGGNVVEINHTKA